MSKVFDPKKLKKLDSPERRKMMPPIDTLNRLGLKEGDIVADIGCGIGYFSIPAASIVGNGGKVYALDISTDMLEYLDQRLMDQTITGIKTVLSEPYNLKLDAGSTTFALAAMIMHETEDLHRFCHEVFRIIESNGRIGIIEWQKKETTMGPPLNHRISETELSAVLDLVGFSGIHSELLGDNLYLLTAIR